MKIKPFKMSESNKGYAKEDLKYFRSHYRKCLKRLCKGKGLKRIKAYNFIGMFEEVSYPQVMEPAINVYECIADQFVSADDFMLIQWGITRKHITRAEFDAIGRILEWGKMVCQSQRIRSLYAKQNDKLIQSEWLEILGHLKDKLDNAVVVIPPAFKDE